MTQVNGYSARWFEFFHAGIPEERTARETAFVCTHLPRPAFTRITDLCCGMGRHARALAQRGYSVIGVERDSAAVVKARELGGGPIYVHLDAREYRPEAASLDAVIIMSQSFGLFDHAANRELLARLAGAIRPGGRIILDLWNPPFFAARQGTREFALPGGLVRETKRIDADRLFVQLEYPDGGHDDFEWQLFSPPEMRDLAKSVGLSLVLACTDFEAAAVPSEPNPRLQFVLERDAV